MTLMRLGTVALALAFAACNGKQEHAEHPEEGPMEEAGEEMDESAEGVEETGEEAVDETGDAFEEAGEEVDEETDEME